MYVLPFFASMWKQRDFASPFIRSRQEPPSLQGAVMEHSFTYENFYEKLPQLPTYEYFREKLPQSLLSLEKALFYNNAHIAMKIQQYIGKLLLLAEEFLSYEQWLLLIECIQLPLYLNQEQF